MPDLKLFVSPRACSLSCHIALEESGLAHEVQVVRIRNGEHRTGEYLRVNPWGKIPALQIGEEVLTEAQAILSYIGDTSSHDLLPRNNALARARAHEWMNFLTATVHIAFRPIFRPHFFLEDESLYPLLHKSAVPRLCKTLLEVERRLTGKHWALGDAFSVVDPYLLVFWIWCQRVDVRPHVPEMPAWHAHAEKVFGREATWKCLNREGITPDNISDP